MNGVTQMFSRTLVNSAHLLVMAGLMVHSSQLLAQQTLYKAGKVITIAGEPLSPGMVLVDQGKIVSVGESLDVEGDVKVIELGDHAVLMPGLVDAYSQLGLSVSTSDEYTSEVTPDFATARSIDWELQAMKRARSEGTTTVCVCPGTENVIAGIASIVKTDYQGEASIINADGPLVANLCNDPTRRNSARQRPDSIYVRQPTNRMGVVWLIRSTFEQARNNGDNERLTPLREVVQGDRQFYIISRTSADISSALTLGDEFGYKPVIVGGQESNKVLDLLADKAVSVVLTPIPTGSTSGIEGTDVCLNRAGKLAEAGVTFCLSGNDLLEQARFAVRFGLDRQTALESVTIAPAKLLGLETKIGSIAAGLDADLIVLDGDPLELTSRIRLVIIGGGVVSGDLLDE